MMFCTSFLDNLWFRVFSSKPEPPPHTSAPSVEINTLPPQIHEEPGPLKQDFPVVDICRACQAGLFSYEGFLKAIADFHYADTGYCYTTTWRDVSRSVREESCNWCDILSQAKDGLPTSKFPRGVYESVEVRVQITITPQLDWIDVTNTIKFYLNGYAAATYSIYAKEGDPAATDIGTGNHVRQQESYFDYPKALDHIEECEHHDYCPAMVETYLPTRVIDCSDRSKPRLVDTQRQVKAHYCTLSYVWGGEQHQKTTTSNVNTYLREGINVPLPRTITDAIIVTHNLGIRYLWVDALCIIQDSAEDKVKELADMAHIYRDSYVTISVLSAYRADEGFLHDERPAVELPFYIADESLGRMLLKYIIPRQSRALGYKHQTVEMHSPLDTRGWCFQESILSPRRLIFQPPYVHYKCRSWSKELTRESEFESVQPAYQVDDHTIFPVIKQKDNVNPTEVDIDNDQLYDLWCSMLSEYTSREISVPTDKLIAFSSVAEEFQSRLQDDYLAGLWRRTLIDGLLWNIFRAPAEALRARPLAYRAPTWSWASVDGMVLPYRKHMLESPSTDYEAEILACEVTPKSGVHPLGEIAEAKLTMNAKIQPLMPNGQKCTFTEEKGISSGDELEHISLSGAWIPPAGNCLEASQASLVNGLSDEERNTERIGITFDCSEGTTQDREMDFHVVVLRAGQRWGNDEGYRKESWMRGLLVLRVDDQVEQYRRVAMLDLWRWKWPDWVEATPLKPVTLI